MNTWCQRALLFTTLALMTGCGGYYYAPNMHNTPLFREAREFTGNLALSGGENFLGLDAALAYAPVNHFGLIGGGSIVGVEGRTIDSSLSYSNEEIASGYLVEVGAGYFTPISEKMSFEFYGGGGIGQANNWHEGEVCSSTSFSRYFMQPALGFRANKISIGISARMCGLEFQKAKCNGMIQDEVERIEYLKANPFSWLLEPAFTLRYGSSFAKFQFQLVWSQNLSHPSQHHDNVNVNLGVFFHISPKGVRVIPVKVENN